jgi:hypothetical protein
MRLVQGAQHLIQGGFSYNKLQDAEQLYAGAQSFFNSLKHLTEPSEEGVGTETFQEHWENENKQVIMFSGCRDDQTSADASVGGGHVGAMSWAFLETMKNTQGQASYLQILQDTRQNLQGKYEQVPQLSMGTQMDLNTMFTV